MAKKTKTADSCGSEKYLKDIFVLIRKVETMAMSDKKTHFNGTELRLLGEIMAAKYIGKRMISTQLAKSLGVTRSAISQMVNRLEEQGIVKRVPDEVDRKIAYIELTDRELETYRKDLEVYVNFLDRVVKKFGGERFEKMIAMFNEFYALVHEEKTNIAQ